jgi:hypothetical protein
MLTLDRAYTHACSGTYESQLQTATVAMAANYIQTNHKQTQLAQA